MPQDLLAALADSDCERLGRGWLVQPANALSSLAYVAVGIGVLCRSLRPGIRRSAARAGGAGLVGVGVGSVAYHGPQPGWAGPAHDGSIGTLILIGAVLVGAAVRRRRTTTKRSVVLWKAAAAWMTAALAAHLAGKTGSAFCHPASPWQPHAVWHVLSAVGLGCGVVASTLWPSGH